LNALKLNEYFSRLQRNNSLVSRFAGHPKEIRLRVYRSCSFWAIGAARGSWTLVISVRCDSGGGGGLSGTSSLNTSFPKRSLKYFS
jgi:hypothetical protein